MKIREELPLGDKGKIKNFIRVRSKKSGKVLFEKENLVVQRARLFTLEKLFDDYFTHSDNGSGITKINYYTTLVASDQTTYESDSTLSLFLKVDDGSDLGYHYAQIVVDSYIDPIDGVTTIPSRAVAEVNPYFTTNIDVLFGYINQNNFRTRKICFFKVGRGGTTSNPLEPVPPVPNDTDLKEKVPFRAVDVSSSSNDESANYTEKYCLPEEEIDVSTDSNLIRFYGKFFDNVDPVWEIDTEKNIICKKIEMSLDSSDLRDVVVERSDGGVTVENKKNVEKLGIVSLSEDYAVCIPNVATLLDMTGVAPDSIISIASGIVTYEFKVISIVPLKNTEGLSQEALIISKTSLTGDDFTALNDLDDFYEATLLDGIGGSSVNTIGDVKLISSFRTDSLEQNGAVSYVDTLGNERKYAIASKTADASLGRDPSTEITENGFRIRNSVDSTLSIQEVSVVKIFYDEDCDVIGLGLVDPELVMHSMLNEVGIYFGEIYVDGSSHNQIVKGSDELFSRITFASKLLEDNEELLIEYFIYT